MTNKVITSDLVKKQFKRGAKIILSSQIELDGEKSEILASKATKEMKRLKALLDLIVFDFPIEVRVLELRYIKNLKMEYIATKLNCVMSTVYLYHGTGIAKITEKLIKQQAIKGAQA